jgi:pimeloyl-ACP methyl ester carboxylesterase
VNTITRPQPSRLEALVQQSQNWEWRGHSIRHVCQGQGQPILLIHGFGGSIGHWKHNIPVLAAAGYQVYALDLLGFGASDKPALDYHMELWQALVEDFWQAHIRQPMVIVGNSIGGLLTLMLLADRPDMARGGVLLNPAGSLNHRADDLNPLVAQVLGTFTKIASSPQLGPWMFDRVRQKHRIRGSLQQIYRNRAAITDELVDMLYAPSCDSGAQKVFASIISGPPGPRPGDLLPQIGLPLLVLWGEDDPWTPYRASTLYQQAAQTQDLQLIPLPKTGHCPHDERPELVNACLLSWLSQLNP